MVKERLLFIRIALALLLASALLSQSSLVRAVGVPVPPAGSLSAVNTKGDPVALWSITWTTSSRYVYDDTRETNFFRWDFNLAQSGSTIVRQYADGAWDNASFNWHVIDDFNETYNYYEMCPPPWGWLQPVLASGNHTWSITDPDRYTGTLDPVLNVTPEQLPDGTWRASVPFDTLLGPGNIYVYTLSSDGEDTSCGYTRPWGGTSQYGLPFSSCALSFPAFIEGDAQGNDFTYHDEFTGLYTYPYPTNGGCQNYSCDGSTATLSIDIQVHRLLGMDLTVRHLEVTQGLQDVVNSIPLVQGRRTVVRAFIDLGTSVDPIPGVTGKLTGYSGGTLLGTVAPFNPNGRITAPVNPDWMNIDDTLNFELPLAWTRQPSLTLTVEVNPGRSVVEANYDNNELSADVSPRTCKGISIGYTPIHYDPPGGAPADPSASIRAGQKFMQKIYPVPEKGIVYKPRGAMILKEDINATGNDKKLLESLEALLVITSPPHPDHLYGWLPSLAYNDNGLGYRPGAAAFGNETPDRWRRTFAHEVGHNLGLRHPPETAPLTTDGDHWFDVYDRVIQPVPAGVGGSSLLDFMVPERLEPEAWISRQNYNYLIAKMCSPLGAAASTESSLPQVGDNLIVTGSIGNTTPATGALSPLFRLSTVPTSTLLIGWQYCVNLKDAGENLLNGYCFNASFDDDSETPAGAAPFSMVVPYPAGLNRVELIQNPSGPVLSSLVASANPPSVSVTFPNASGLALSGNQTITWTGSDSDYDPLTYAILYSRDNGATWMGAATDITGTSYSLDFSALAGTDGASGLIKVLVSDGFYSAEDTSDNPFTVGNKPPSAIILWPSSGASFYTGPQIVLEGSGEDFEDGSLSDSALSWVSNLDGALGPGQLLEVNLSPGVHTITLTATDSKALKDTDSIQVTVVQSTHVQNLFLPFIRR